MLGAALVAKKACELGLEVKKKKSIIYARRVALFLTLADDDIDIHDPFFSVFLNR